MAAAVTSTLNTSMEEILSVDPLYAAAVESTVSGTHAWAAQLFSNSSTAILLAQASSNILNFPYTEQDFFHIDGSVSTMKGLTFYFDPREFPNNSGVKTLLLHGPTSHADFTVLLPKMATSFIRTAMATRLLTPKWCVAPRRE